MTKENNISSFDFRSQLVTKGSTGRPALHLNLAQINHSRRCYQPPGSSAQSTQKRKFNFEL